MQSLEFRAMNSAVLLAAEGQGALEARLQEARQLIEDYEKRFSRFLPDSELSGLNRSAGSWVKCSDELFELLQLSRAYHAETRGLFDPSILPDLKRAGYDRSLELVLARTDKTSDAKQVVARRADFAAVEVDSEQQRVLLPKGMELDFGGIAKGWIAQRAAIRLSEHARACAVSAGGDIVFIGSPPAGGKWRVEIEDPRNPAATLAVLSVGQGAVVTSSISLRKWLQDGEEKHHLIDPRTGEPAKTEWLSMTVVAPYADLAEAYAKALLIGGSHEVTRLLLQRPRLAAIGISADGQIWASPKGKEYLEHGSGQHSNSSNAGEVAGV